MASTVKPRPRASTRSTSSSYSSEEWSSKRELITKLYFDERKTLREVRSILEHEHNFTPTERMYKSRLHQWGLDKKKKEPEMLAILRTGMRQKNNGEDVVFDIRGRQVTFGDALHYFSRKGIKDPEALLESLSPASSSSPSSSLTSPSDRTVRSSTYEGSDSVNSDFDDKNFYEDNTTTMPVNLVKPPLPDMVYTRSDTAVTTPPADEDSSRVEHAAAQSTPNFYPFLPPGSSIPSLLSAPSDYRHTETMLGSMFDYYNSIFVNADWSVNCTAWSATSGDSSSDHFFFRMCHGHAYLWNAQSDLAFERFDEAFGMIGNLLKNQHVGFMIYVFDLIIRLQGGGLDGLLNRLLVYLAEMAHTVFSENHPIRLIATTMLQAPGDMKIALAETALRKILQFFQDSIGYFHLATIAVLQTYASALKHREQHAEATRKYEQLVEAFETTHGKESYEACFAVRVLAESLLYQRRYGESTRCLEDALERSQRLPYHQKAEMRARVLRGKAELANRFGRYNEAASLMREGVKLCTTVFGADHPFTKRAAMHLDSLSRGPAMQQSSIPPIVHHIGRGGKAALYIWTTHSRSQLPLG